MTTLVGAPESLHKLGFAAQQLVQEFGYDSDVDDDVRFAVEDIVGSELEDEDFTGGADAVMLWWRAEDGDLVDGVVDVIGALVDGGFVVLLTPRPGHAGQVDASLVDEAAQTAGMHTSCRLVVSGDWQATRLVQPKSAKR